MKRLAILAPVAAALLVACQDVQQPTADFDVSDGSSFGGFGNPHFFFLPPLVPSPEYSGIFDGSLLAYLRIEVTGPFADEGLASCEGPVYDTLDETDGLSVDLVHENYSIGWNDNHLEEDKVYRLCVRLQPAPTLDALLGFRDVQPTQGGGSVSENPVYMFNHGSNLPVKLRVEEGVLSAELCTAGVLGPDYDCTAQILANNETAICENATCALSTPDNGLAEPTLFLIERVECPVDGNGYADWIGVDIPQYGGCMLITVFDPEWQGFLNEQLATVATCPDLSTGPPLYAPSQDESMQLHLERGAGDVTALPPRFSAIDGDCIDPNPELALAPDASLPTKLAWVVRSGLRRMQRAVRNAVAPTAAYAFHTGFGGHTKLRPTEETPGAAPSEQGSLLSGPVLSMTANTSETETTFHMAWAIPSQMEKVTPLETVMGNVGDVVPVQVLVTDNGRTSNTNQGPGRPVRGASVHFAVVNPGGLVTPGTATTDGDGLATVNWTLQPGGYLQLDATGFGIGVRPATGFGGFDALGNLERQLETGTLTFDAIACDDNTPGLARAVVDGQINGLDRYENANVYQVPVNLGGRNSGTAVLYVGNDCANMYLALAVPAEESTNNSLRFVFDNVFGNGESADDDILSIGRNGSGAWEFRDRYLSADCLGSKQSNCGPNDPGVPDGAGAVGWNDALTLEGLPNTGYFVYEIVHPLASGDAQHDFQRAFGEQVGFYFAVSLGNGSKGNTEWPDQKGRFKTYQSYEVQGPPIP